MIARPLSILLVVAVAGAAACRPSAGTGAALPAAGAAPHTTVAEVDGKPITAEELDRHAASQLQQLRDQEYEIRKTALEDLIGRRLMQKEAAQRGMSEEELKKAEIADKVAPPTSDEIQEIYDANRGRVGGRSRAEVEPQIVSSVVQQRVAERTRAFAQALRDQAAVKILLEQPRTEVKVPAGTAVLGPADAKVTIVEFSDYLCPYCQSAEAVVSKVLARYEGKVKFVHLDLLLGRPRSLPVAKAALCAGDQGKFWDYRHQLLTTTGDWSDQDLESRAARMGLRMPDFKACLASDRHEAAINASTEEGSRLGVSGTPTFFINGRRMVGARSEAHFDEIIQAELK
jgi:protein-disulfide isomerase